MSGDDLSVPVEVEEPADEIREIFMQVSIYAGIPAGVDSFRIAREVFAELDNKA